MHNWQLEQCGSRRRSEELETVAEQHEKIWTETLEVVGEINDT